MPTITIKLTKLPRGITSFDIFDQLGNTIALAVPKEDLISGISYDLTLEVTMITLKSNGSCSFSKTVAIKDITYADYRDTKALLSITGCIWTHLNNPQLYNSFYGKIEPYIIEYPFAYKYHDEVLQNIQDYTKSYKYLTRDLTNSNHRIETDNNYFNKAVLYNGQQSTGILELVEKRQNNLSANAGYPFYNVGSKSILYTKSDNFYQYNTFWVINKSSQVPLFVDTCENKSIDKVVNQSNMDYSSRSFQKAPLRAKELKVRHILDNTDNVHLVSQFIISPVQTSYK